ncbi:MAG: sugar ABC transporter permease [Caldilineaceae bacterium]|nr:sugar ABC transporter permease [Caldilineaceae bacterium]
MLPNHRPNRRPNRLLLALAFLLIGSLLAMLLLTALLSITDASTSDPVVQWVGLDNYLRTVRSFLFRNALLHTFLVYAGAQVGALLLAMLSRPLLTRRWRGRAGFTLLLCLPLLMPATLGTLAWRQLLFPMGIHSDSALPLAGLAAVDGWRLWPIFALLLAILPRSKAMVLAALVGAIWVLTDAATPLVLIGGAPFQATDLWPSWIFQNAFSGGLIGESAAAAMLMLPSLAILAGSIAWIADRLPLQEEKDDRKLALGWIVVAGLLALVAGLPLVGQAAALRLEAFAPLMHTAFPRWLPTPPSLLSPLECWQAAQVGRGCISYAVSQLRADDLFRPLFGLQE